MCVDLTPLFHFGRFFLQENKEVRLGGLSCEKKEKEDEGEQKEKPLIW